MEPELIERLLVDPAVLSALNVTREQIHAMTLSEFCDRVIDAGYGLDVSTGPTDAGKGNLTITMNTATTSTYSLRE